MAGETPQSWLDDHDNWLTWNEKSVAEYAAYRVRAALEEAALVLEDKSDAAHSQGVVWRGIDFGEAAEIIRALMPEEEA